ncbi:MAG TPA: sigma-54 dependent transcriptional regulator [Oligoflexia bacterium]|nr:sigma-54 dependent transcriptional regulator [Oligoflexia bacterium]
MVNNLQSATILAVDDHPDALYVLERILVHQGYHVLTASSGTQALDLAKEHRPSLILLDIMMPQMDGLETARRLKADSELRFIPLVLVTAKDTLEDVIAGLDAGADGYITKPFRPEELLARTRAALRIERLYDELRTAKENNTRLEQQLSSRYAFSQIIGQSKPMQDVFALVAKVAPSNSPVLITGASGTGKELIARAIHFNSPRSSAAFIAQNCAAFSEHLLESQLFGHVRGAFTGAIRDQKGLFEAAGGGTLFLDEIGEMMPSLQAKLLRVLQEGSFMPVGSTEERRVDVRVLAASNRDLAQMCEEGSFREDLYYRLNVIGIHLPLLRERKEDIPLLAQEFLRRAAARRNAQPKIISADAMERLKQHHWRGNVRELENEIERMLILSGESEELGCELLSPTVAAAVRDEIANAERPEGSTLKASIEGLERRLIYDALRQARWNKSTAAKALGISRSNLIAKVKQYGLE